MTIKHRFNDFCNHYVNFVYVMWIPSLRYLWCSKIGISNEPDRRRAEVEASIKKETGKEVKVYYISIPFIGFRHWEKKLLWFGMWFYGTREMPGSGRTEWRMIRNWITAGLLCYFAKPMHGHGEILRFLFLVFLPGPIDFILLVVVAFLVEIAFVGGVVGLLFYTLKHFL